MLYLRINENLVHAIDRPPLGIPAAFSFSTQASTVLRAAVFSIGPVSCTLFVIRESRVAKPGCRSYSMPSTLNIRYIDGTVAMLKLQSAALNRPCGRMIG